jgi:hypothetical protein
LAAGVPRLVGAVAATAVVALAGGFAVGRLTEPAPANPAGSPGPLVTEAMPSPSRPSPTVPKKTPVPDPAERLDPDDLAFVRQTFTVTKSPHPAATVTLHVPEGWQLSRPGGTDEVRFTDPARKRWIRVESGFAVERPPADSMSILITNLRGSQPYENAFTMLARTTGQQPSRDGEGLRNLATLEYTYIPHQSIRHVFVRWVGFGEGGDAAVEMSVTGLQQDRAALEKVLERASATVERTD